MKKVYLTFVAVGILITIICCSIYIWYKNETSPVSSSNEKVTFIVPRGSSASEIGSLLYDNKLIRSKLAFKIYLMLVNKTKSINAGEFELTPSMDVAEIVSTLQKGPKELWVVIPEGLRKEEIAVKITSALQMDSKTASAFEKQFLNLAKNDEGFLFPDTYLFPKEATTESVYNRLKSTFDEKYTTLVKQYPDNKHTKAEIVTMASILERETKTVAEKPIVAGILWKRIDSGWPLQVDATVQYAVSTAKETSRNSANIEWWPVLTIADLEIDSTYNTYKNNGLPPRPICNPGLESLKAALTPQASDYWFYIHSPDGVIHYAKTSQEHAANVRKYLGK